MARSREQSYRDLKREKAHLQAELREVKEKIRRMENWFELHDPWALEYNRYLLGERETAPEIK